MNLIRYSSPAHLNSLLAQQSENRRKVAILQVMQAEKMKSKPFFELKNKVKTQKLVDSAFGSYKSEVEHNSELMMDEEKPDRINALQVEPAYAI